VQFDDSNTAARFDGLTECIVGEELGNCGCDGLMVFKEIKHAGSWLKYDASREREAPLVYLQRACISDPRRFESPESDELRSGADFPAR
jgi:hypothetical protein